MPSNNKISVVTLLQAYRLLTNVITYQLYKSLAVACGDRKYFSSTFGSKMSISDKVDAFPVLRNAVEA